MNAPRLMAGAALACGLAAVHAAPSAAYLQFGTAGHTHTLSGGVVFDWQRHRPWAHGMLNGYWEVSLGAWTVDEASTRRHAWVGQVGVTPVLRYGGETTPWFAEAGVGVHVVAPLYQGNGKRFTTVLNFAEHVAVGRRVGEQGELALRFQHFSNAGIRRPNPGENFWQLRWSWRFE